MKKILFVMLTMLAMLALTISAVPAMASQSQIQTRTGDVIVVDGRCFLDTDNDGNADIYLDFGPPWYDPGIPRPSDGDSVEVTGKLTGEGTPDAEMDVYYLDGIWWRNPGRPPWAGPHPQGK